MKKLLILIPFFILFLPFLSFITDKTYKVELPLKRWLQHNNGLVYIKTQLLNSDLQARIVTYMIDSIITPLQLDMMQVNLQLPKDTAKQK